MKEFEIPLYPRLFHDYKTLEKTIRLLIHQFQLIQKNFL